MTRWVLPVLIVFVVTGGVVAGATQYRITIESGIDTPDRQVTLQGSTFTVRGIAEITAGETITATVSRPDSGRFQVYVYGTVDGKRTQMDHKGVSSGNTVSFSKTGSYSPGIYTLALYADGDFRAVYPFIVKGATIDLQIPSRATTGDQVSVNAAVSATSPNVDVTGVEFVLHGPGGTKRVTASGDSSPYEATFDTGGLAAGDYSIYAVVTNASQTPTGDPEPVGLSTQQSITIESKTTTGSGDTGGGGSSSPTTTTTTTTTSTTSVTSTTQTTQSTTQTTDSTPTITQTGNTPSTDTTTTTTTATTTTANSGVITPNTQTATPAASPGFTVLTAGLASMAVLLLFRRNAR